MRGEAIILFSQPLPISPPSSLVASRGEGGWGKVATESQACPASSHSTVPSTEGTRVTPNKGRYRQPGPAAA